VRPGIYLGPRRGGLDRIVRRLAVVGVVATLAHAGWYVRTELELRELRASLEERDQLARVDVLPWTPDETRSLRHLVAVSASGAPEALAATELLSLLEDVLPESVTVVSATLTPAADDPGLVVEALASRQQDISDLEARLAAHARVERTEVLEERRSRDGSFSIRVQARLVPQAPR